MLRRIATSTLVGLISLIALSMIIALAQSPAQAGIEIPPCRPDSHDCRCGPGQSQQCGTPDPCGGDPDLYGLAQTNHDGDDDKDKATKMATVKPSATPKVDCTPTPHATFTLTATVITYPTYTPQATYTPGATQTALSTYTPNATQTALPTYTPFPTYTPLPTYTPAPTATPKPMIRICYVGDINLDRGYIPMNNPWVYRIIYADELHLFQDRLGLRIDSIDQPQRCPWGIWFPFAKSHSDANVPGGTK